MTPFASIIEAEMTRQKVTAAELARRADMPRQTVWRYVQGKQEPNLTATRALVRALGKSLTWLDRRLAAEKQES